MYNGHWTAYYNFVGKSMIHKLFHTSGSGEMMRIRSNLDPDPQRWAPPDRSALIIYVPIRDDLLTARPGYFNKCLSKISRRKVATKSAKALKGYSPLAARLEGEKLEDLLSDGGRQELLQGIRSLHQHTTQSR
jgi:hypothetical protein